MRPLHNSSLRAERSNPENTKHCFYWIAASPSAPRNDKKQYIFELCNGLYMIHELKLAEETFSALERNYIVNPICIRQLSLDSRLRGSDEYE